MPDFSKRATGPELMDDLDAVGPDLQQALRELDGINYVLGGNYVTLNALSQLLGKQPAQQTFSVADLGCGSGDMLRRIRRLLERRGLQATLTGFDANPNVVSFAVDHTPTTCRISYEPVNIFSKEFRQHRFDIVVATLFYHHFTGRDLIEFFKSLKHQVSVGIIINDIHRHWFAYYSIKWLTKMFSRSSMVKHDAPVSVLRAFRRKELETILRDAGWTRYRIKWCWAFRWQVVAWLH